MLHPAVRSYLRTRRRQWGLTQDELAFLVGLKDGTSIGKGEWTHAPTLATAIACALLFDSCVLELLPGAVADVERGVVQRAEQLLKELSKLPQTERVRAVSALLHTAVARKHRVEYRVCCPATRSKRTVGL